MFIQNYDFQTALLTTFGKRLYYSTEVIGNGEPVISDRKICNILCDLRDKSQEILIDMFSARDRYLVLQTCFSGNSTKSTSPIV